MPSTLVRSVSEARDAMYDYLMKMIVIGDCYVGKSAITSQYCVSGQRASVWEIYTPTIGEY